MTQMELAQLVGAGLGAAIALVVAATVRLLNSSEDTDF